MKEVQIKEGYQYIEFNNDIEMFSFLELKINDGYVITDTVGISIEIMKNNSYMLLSFNHIDVIDEGIKDKLKLNKEEIVEPDYNDTLLSVDAYIRDSFGYRTTYPIIKDINKKYKRYVILVLDGLGSHILKMLPDASFLKSCYKRDIHAIYPSTTAAATTSIKAGLSPLETCWTGWENYIREINKNVVLFSGVDYFSDEPTGVSTYRYIPYKLFFDDMNVKGSIIEPDFSKSEHNIDDVLKRSLDGLKNGDVIQYVYHHNPDHMLHMEGLCQHVLDDISYLDGRIYEYAKKLPEDTLLIVSADHGHIDVSELNFYSYSMFYKMLERQPANDARCIVFTVKDECKADFERLFNGCFKNVYTLYKTEDAIKKGFFGNGPMNPRIKDFLGNYVAVAINTYYFNYKNVDDFLFKSHHAGITAKEINIPLCLYEAK